MQSYGSIWFGRGGVGRNVGLPLHCHKRVYSTLYPKKDPLVTVTMVKAHRYCMWALEKQVLWDQGHWQTLQTSVLAQTDGVNAKRCKGQID